MTQSGAALEQGDVAISLSKALEAWKVLGGEHALAEAQLRQSLHAAKRIRQVVTLWQPDPRYRMNLETVRPDLTVVLLLLPDLGFEPATANARLPQLVAVSAEGHVRGRQEGQGDLTLRLPDGAVVHRRLNRKKGNMEVVVEEAASVARAAAGSARTPISLHLKFLIARRPMSCSR